MHIHIASERSLLTTFYTHLGRICFKCMPFGFKISQDVFQMKLDQTVERCPGILCIHHHLCIYSKSEREHDVTLLNLMHVASNDCLVVKSRKSNGVPSKSPLWHYFLQRRQEPNPANILSQKSPLRCTTTVIFRHDKFYATIIPYLLHYTAPFRK